MKWMKKNKFTVVAIVLFVLIAVFTYKVVQIFFPNERTAYYGDRLDGKVSLGKGVIQKAKEKINEDDKVKKVTIRENGRRIDIVVTVTNNTNKEEAKKTIGCINEVFNESQLGYYDIQVYIKKDEPEENDFPIIGYKHHNLSSFSWSKDRDKKEEVKEEQ